MKYKEEFQKEMVRKILLQERNVTELSQEIGVCTNTLYNWKNKFATSESEKTCSRSPRSWQMKEKVKAVLEYIRLSTEETGYWLRQKGLKSEHLKIWEKELIEMATSNKYKDELKKIKKEKDTLAKELSRKEKALAEVSALLVLKKKVNNLFLEEEEN